MSTISSYIGDGSNRLFNVTFAFVTTAQVKVRVQGNDVTFTWTGPAQVQTTVAPGTGDLVEVYRSTDVSAPSVDFTDGAVLLATDLEAAVGQSRQAVEEMKSEVDALRNRSVTMSAGESPIILPPVSQRANAMLGFGPTGLPIAVPEGGDASTLRSQLLSTTGGTMVTYQAPFNYAAYRSITTKLGEGELTPEDFGAVSLEGGGGAVDNYTALTRAFAAGRVINGHGKTYRIGQQLTLGSGSGFKGMRNMGFGWVNKPAMQSQQFLVKIMDAPDHAFVENCIFNIGDEVYCGSSNDSTRGGLWVTTSSPNVTFNRFMRIRGNIAKGDGNGTRLMIRSVAYGEVSGNVIQWGQGSNTPDPTNDIVNGIEVTQGYNNTVFGNRVEGLASRLVGAPSRLYSRGMLFTELRHSTIYGNTIRDVDQGMDFSGGIDATNPNGNVGLMITGNTISDVRKFGIKAANVTRDTVIAGNTVMRFGLAAIVVSPSSVTLADNAKNTQRITVANNILTDATGEDQASNYGVWIAANATYSPGYPRAVMVTGNKVTDNYGGNKLAWGYRNEMTYDGSSTDLNICDSTNSSKGHVTADMTGFSPPGVLLGLSGNQTIANNTATPVNFNAESYDGYDGHSMSSNLPIYFIKKSGYYQIEGYVEFVANATGKRFLSLMKNGGLVRINQETAPDATNAAGINVTWSGYLIAGTDSVSLSATQTSGGNLDIQRAALSVMPVDMRL